MKEVLKIAEINPSHIVGLRIKKLRSQRGLTGKKLGQQLQLSQQHISRIENGSVRLNIEQLRHISQALEVEFIELLAGIGYQAKQLHTPFFCRTISQANSIVTTNYPQC